VNVDRIVEGHYRDRMLLARAAAKRAQTSWRQIDQANIAPSWKALLSVLLRWLTSAQAKAARDGVDYVDRVVRAVGGTPRPIGRAVPESLAGVASDGRDLASLLNTPLTGVFKRLEDDAPVDDALQVGLHDLVRIVSTQITDASRVATGVAMVNDEYVSGYVRIVHLPACGRCIILAGREYSYSTGFQRHPRCDCTMRPLTREEWDSNVPGTDPRELFEAMPAEQQDKAFTRAGARAIRDGADISQIVNARRGMTTAGGRSFTTEGTTVRGLAGKRLGDATKQRGSRYRRSRVPRLMPEQIYAEADRLGWDRAEIVRQLTRFGYIY
jgi:hypothetical protein